MELKKTFNHELKGGGYKNVFPLKGSVREKLKGVQA